MSTNLQAELLLDARAKLGEGAIWDNRNQTLCWVDIEQRRLHVFDPSTGANRAHDLGQMVSTVVPRARGGYAVALQRGFYSFDPAIGKIEPLHEPEQRPTVRFNDGKCDPSGRFWAGTMPMGPDSGKPIGHLYRLDADHSCHVILDGIRCSNGIVWTADRRTMYYIDTPTRRIDAFDYDDATGAVSNRRPLIEFAKEAGHPDGMTIDEEGRLWVAFWGGFAVRCVDPKEARVIQTIDVPAPQVTSCAFGGPALDVLYITTAAVGLSEEKLQAHPHSGGVFQVRPGARGVPAFAYEG